MILRRKKERIHIALGLWQTPSDPLSVHSLTSLPQHLEISITMASVLQRRKLCLRDTASFPEVHTLLNGGVRNQPLVYPTPVPIMYVVVV